MVTQPMALKAVEVIVEMTMNFHLELLFAAFSFVVLDSSKETVHLFHHMLLVYILLIIAVMVVMMVMMMMVL